jgi:hypothetical protein
MSAARVAEKKEQRRPTGYRDAPEDQPGFPPPQAPPGGGFGARQDQGYGVPPGQQPWWSVAPRTGLVSGVAVANLLTGGLFFYLAFWFCRPDPGAFFTLNFFWLAPPLAFVGVVHLLAARAVWKRLSWGRTLAIVLSALPALCAVLVLGYSVLGHTTDGLPLGAVFLAWAAYPNIVLLQQRYAEEFPPSFSRAG